MKKEQILNSEGWKYISSLSAIERHQALFGRSQSEIENAYNVKIEKWAFTKLSELSDNYVSLSVTDSFKDIAFIAVLVPKKQI